MLKVSGQASSAQQAAAGWAEVDKSAEAEYFASQVEPVVFSGAWQAEAGPEV